MAITRARPRRGYPRELRLVRGAIAMVASGGAPRVSVSSLRFGGDLLEPASAMALEAGVRLLERRGADDAVTGLVLEPIDG